MGSITLHLLFLSITFSQEACHPHAPFSFAYFTLLQNVFVLRLGCVAAHTRTHPPVISTLLASSAITVQSCLCSISQERKKSKDNDCVWSEEGSYKEERSHLQSQPHQSTKQLYSLSSVLWFTGDDKPRGLWLEVCGKEGSQEKKPCFYFYEVALTLLSISIIFSVSFPSSSELTLQGTKKPKQRLMLIAFFFWERHIFCVNCLVLKKVFSVYQVLVSWEYGNTLNQWSSLWL